MRRSSSKNTKIQNGRVAARETDGSEAAAFYAFGRPAAFAVLLVGAMVVLPSQPASALPSFARQTGQPCSSCHNAFP